jgi:hypothetical protein
MNESDQKIRKQWLVIWVLSMLTGTIPVMPQIYFLVGLLGFFVIFLLFGLCWFFMYRCIYKNLGTKLLIFCLVATAVSLVITPIQYLSNMLIAPSYIPHPYYGVYILVNEGVGIGWFIACWRMRTLNKRLQKSRSTS